MEGIAWVLAAAFGIATVVLIVRARSSPVREAAARLAAEVRSGGPVAESHREDPPEIAELRAVLARPGGGESDEEDPGEVALKGLFRYVEGAVLEPLEASLRDPRGDGRLQDALDALRDLAFYADRDLAGSNGTDEAAEGRRDADPLRPENLPSLVQDVTREYTLETGVPVRFSGPPEALPVRVGPERFKDALYLLLANAGHFGKGATVDVVTEAEGDAVRLRIRDRGPGFTPEALERAFDPFWSTEADALGLGLTFARRTLEAQGARLRIGNRDADGAEVVIELARSG